MQARQPGGLMQWLTKRPPGCHKTTSMPAECSLPAAGCTSMGHIEAHHTPCSILHVRTLWIKVQAAT